MATGLRRDDRRALAGTGSPGQDRGRLRSTANFGRKCSRISPFDQDDDARPRCPWIIDNRHATLQIPHAYLPDSMQGSGRRVIASDAATVSFPDSLPVTGRWRRPSFRLERRRRHQATQNPPALRRGRTKVGYDGTVLTWLPEPDDGSAFPTLSDPCFATATP